MQNQETFPVLWAECACARTCGQKPLKVLSIGNSASVRTVPDSTQVILGERWRWLQLCLLFMRGVAAETGIWPSKAENGVGLC